MLFAIICKDKAGALQTRLDNREKHLAYLAETGIVQIAGPFLEDGRMTGSMVVVEGDSIEVAKDWAANDPYAKAGLFEDVRITEWKKVVG
ncbi:YciI family protein [Paenirhodobacter enshiensis]|uniref:YCII-related domain-containing protein n=1 Tax=Paenirhodobacter enshiensis TaxID=1105367 RepID=A0A086Y3R3_9RHOB|nr:YciI family protein [Paenirhodobacter enshiensis]KFI28913.1 hypothetical protein CG50_11970 [Paenirhodobacter enshiensis]